MQWNIRRRKTRSERLRETSCCDEWRYGDVVIADLAIVFSETSGILDYCRENDITFFSYMVLEQGALSGKYDTRHPFPADSDRGAVYNHAAPVGETEYRSERDCRQARSSHCPASGGLGHCQGYAAHHRCDQKVYQVEDAAKAAALELSADEIETMERLASETPLNVIRYWEKEMK